MLTLIFSSLPGVHALSYEPTLQGNRRPNLEPLHSRLREDSAMAKLTTT
jgi:hypothetical protein